MKTAGKVALLTGGARIGRTVAQKLAAAGCSVAVSYRTSRVAAQETVDRARSLGVGAVAFRSDFEKSGSCVSLVERVVGHFGRLDILIHLASHYERTPLEALARASKRRGVFEKNMAVDLRSAYELSLLTARRMTKDGGRIIHFCDWVVASGRPRYRGYLPYHTAKAGLKGLTEALALELAPKVLVNAIAPGPILPPPGLSVQSNREVLANTPLGRWGGAEEIAKTVLFLIESDFVTGETIRVDGGRHLY